MPDWWIEKPTPRIVPDADRAPKAFRMPKPQKPRRPAKPAKPRPAPFFCSTEPVSLTLPVSPSMNNMYPTSRSGHRFLSAEGKTFKMEAALAIKGRPIHLFDGDVSVRIKFFRQRRAGDLDNRVKPILDFLTGLCWADDNQVAEIHATRHEDKFNPRVEVIITTLAIVV